MILQNFETDVYSEETFNFTESDYDEVMQQSAADDEWQGYNQWSTELEAST